jgi:hypothetical protein
MLPNLFRPATCCALALVFVGSIASADAAQPPLKEMPKDGELPFGAVVYVDDRKCPKGQLKEVTGGSREKDIPRRVRCVSKPPAAE